MYFKKNKKIKIKKEEKAFVILIAIVISSLLVSLGMFIANVAYKELLLSSSAKESQKAFFIADSAMECALWFDIRGPGFKFDNGLNTDTPFDDRNYDDIILNCNGLSFSPASGNSGTADSFTSNYYISFAEDSDDNGTIETTEMDAQPNAGFAKIVVEKTNNGNNTEITAYGLSRYKGKGVVERAIQTSY